MYVYKDIYIYNIYNIYTYIYKDIDIDTDIV